MKSGIKYGWTTMMLVGLFAGAACADEGGVMRISDSPPPGYKATTPGAETAPPPPAGSGEVVSPNGPAQGGTCEGGTCEPPTCEGETAEPRDADGHVVRGSCLGRCCLCHHCCCCCCCSALCGHCCLTHDGCCLCRCLGNGVRLVVTYNPSKGFRAPTVTPIEREAVVYYRYWPAKWYGEPGFGLRPTFPMVYMPTDTTQLGVYYSRVPQWMPNPGMYPRPPRPDLWNRRVVQVNCPAPNAAPTREGGQPGPTPSGPVIAPESNPPAPTELNPQDLGAPAPPPPGNPQGTPPSTAPPAPAPVAPPAPQEPRSASSASSSILGD